MEYIIKIGLEVHAQLATQTKMFCRCKLSELNERPNVNICPICLGMPGVLPVINQEALRLGLLVGLALSGEVLEYSKFDRKNYFYPDLPKGFQTSQYDLPIVKGGFVDIENGDIVKRINLRRAHLEEDAGKLMHSVDRSLVDLNRAGTPLLEIVSEPDMDTPLQAKTFVLLLQMILRYCGASSADMEKGQMRADANISVQKEGSESQPVEIKNLNSVRAIERALEYEIKRQTEIIKTDGVIEKETRGWDEKNEKTISQRSKEFAHDYRYFPEPDIPPLRLLKIFSVDQLKSTIPELPLAKKKRMINEYNLREKDISALIEHRSIAEFIENSFSELRKKDEEKYKNNIKVAINWFLRDVLGFINDKKISFAEQKITPENLAEFVVLLSKGKISGPLAKELFLAMQETGDDPSHLILERGLEQIGDTGKLLDIIDSVISQNPKVISDFEKGKKEAKMFLVGQVMKDTKGKADPQVVGELLDERLKGF